jgi:PAS domain S-box-containing protein
MDDPVNKRDSETKKQSSETTGSSQTNSLLLETQGYSSKSASEPLSSDFDAGLWERTHLDQTKSPPADLYEKYRLIALSTNDLISFLTFDLNPVYTFVSPSHKRILGYDASEMLGKSGLEMIAKEDQKQLGILLGVYLQAKSNGTLTDKMIRETPRLEYRIRGKSGQLHTLQSTVNIVNNELLFLSRDVTEEKKMEANIKENERRLNAIIQGLSIAAFFIDRNHKVVYWNKALEELSNINTKDVVGTDNQWWAFYSQKRPVLADILIDNDVESINRWYHGKCKKSRLLSDSYEGQDFFPALGDIGKWLQFAATTIRNSEGKVIGVLETLEDISESKKAEIALQDSEKKYRLLFDSATDGIILFDMFGRVVNANEIVSEIIGENKENIIGRHFKDLNLISEKDIPYMLENFGPINSSKGIEICVTIKNKNGEVKYLETCSTNVVRDGKNIGVMCLIHDVTKRKESDEELKHSQEKYRLVVENAMEMIFIAQGDKLKFCNKATLEHLGYSAEEVYSTPFAEFVHPDDRQMVLKNYAARLKGEMALPFYSFRIINKQKACRWVELQPVVITWEGKPASLNFLRDITENRKLIEELAASEQKYHNLYDNLRDGTVATDYKGRFLECNAAFEQITGYSQKELQQMTNKDITPEKWHGVEREIINEQVLKRGYSDLYEKEYRKKDGKIIPVELQVYGLKEDQRRITGFWGFIRDISVRKKMEFEQKLNEERIRAIVMNAPIGIAVMDASTKFISANNAYCEILGYSENTLQKLKCRDLLDSIDVKEYVEKMADLESGKISFFQLERHFITSNGNHIICKVMINAMRDQNGKPYLFISELEDVTDRKRMFDALKKSEEKFVKAFQASPIAITITRLSDGKFIELNDSLEKLSGYSRAELLSHSTIDLGLWQDVKERTSMVQELTEHGSVHNREYRFVHKNGRVIVTRVSAELLDFSGETCFLSTLVDVTEQKKIEESLRESEEKYRSIVENTKDLIMITQPDGKISYLSPACFEIFGYQPEELIGTIPEISYHEDRSMISSAFSSALRGKSGTNYEYRVVTKNREIKWISHSWSPVFSQDQTLNYVVSIVRDVTGSKIAEQKLKEKVMELERYKNITVNREEKMIELKDKIKELQNKLSASSIEILK